MSLFGSYTAVVSVGISCQSALQINEHAGLLSDRLNDDLVQHRGPLDFTICPALSGAGWLSGGLQLPQTPSEIEVFDLGRMSIPWFKTASLIFWHDFHSKDDGWRVDVEESFDSTLVRLNELNKRFFDLREIGRRIFVLSNTQNDLLESRMTYRLSGLDYVITETALELFQKALDATFPGKNDLMVVSYPDRITKTAAESMWKPFLFDKDSSNYEGDPAQWAAAFREFIPHRR